MDHDRPYPGKYEGNRSRRLAEALHNVTMNGGCDKETGTVEYGPGWHGLILRPHVGIGYVVWEDSQGFFGYVREPLNDARADFQKIERDYESIESGAVLSGEE